MQDDRTMGMVLRKSSFESQPLTAKKTTMAANGAKLPQNFTHPGIESSIIVLVLKSLNT